MTRLVLDKNPKQKSDEDLDDIKKVITKNTLNSIMYTDPFLKTTFLTRLISTTTIPVIYLDFDLLYTGYVTAGTLQSHQNVLIFQPSLNDWNKILKTILLRLTEKKSILIIDSLNGFFNLFDERQDVGRLVNSYVMLLTCVANMSKSLILLASMSRRSNGEGWVLSTTGRHITETKHMNRIYLKSHNSSITMNVFGDNDSKKDSYTISIKSELT